jgi:hypothetical protein
MIALSESSSLLTSAAEPHIDSDSCAKAGLLRADRILRAIPCVSFVERFGDSKETRLQFAALATVPVARAKQLSKETKKALSRDLGINNLAHVLAVGSSAWILKRLFTINGLLWANQVALREIEDWLLHYGFDLDDPTCRLVHGRYRKNCLIPCGAPASSK